MGKWNGRRVFVKDERVESLESLPTFNFNPFIPSTLALIWILEKGTKRDFPFHFHIPSPVSIHIPIPM